MPLEQAAGELGNTRHNVVADAKTLRSLHVPGDPLVLANVWDPPTARARRIRRYACDRNGQCGPIAGEWLRRPTEGCLPMSPSVRCGASPTQCRCR